MLDGNCNDDENSLIECCHRRTGGTLINRHLMEVLIGVAVQTLHSYLFCKYTFISIPTCMLNTHRWVELVCKNATPSQLSFLLLTKALLDSFVQNAMLVWTLLFTQIRNKFLQLQVTWGHCSIVFMTGLTRPRQLQPNKTWKIAVKPKSFPPRMQILKGKICLRFF